MSTFNAILEKATEKAAKEATEKATEKTTKEANLRTARAMLANDHPVEYVMKITGLTIDELKEAGLI